jgi:hypothetical protein
LVGISIVPASELSASTVSNGGTRQSLALNMLSSRAIKNIEQLNRPWRFTPTPDYDSETNPKGLISLGLAENVCTYQCRELQILIIH